MKIISAATKRTYNIEVKNTSGEERLLCPECSGLRRKSTEKCFAWNVKEQRGFCHHCNTAFFAFIPGRTGKPYFVPEWKNITDLSDKVVKYFEGRMIKQSVLKEMGVYSTREYMPEFKKEVEAIAFPYFRNGKLVNIKYRGANKSFKLVKDAELVFYNIDSIINSNEIIITEGEIDTLCFIQAGFKNTISVPNGANIKAMEYLDSCIDLIASKDKVYLAVDNDLKGIELRDELARRIGYERCYIVNFLDTKDANEYLQKYTADFMTLIKNAKPIKVRGIIDPLDIYDETKEYFHEGLRRGKIIGMGEVDEYVSWETGRLAVITGIPSHGKALSIDTDIITIDGFKKIKDIHIGDIVFDENGKQCKVIAETGILYNRKCFLITFSDGTKVIADGDHNWLTDTWKSRRSLSNAKRNNRTEDRGLKPHGINQIHKRAFASIKTTEEISKTLKIKSDKRNNHSVKVCKPLDYDEKKLLITPYVLGYWLGDGSKSSGLISTQDIEVVNEIGKSYKINKKNSDKYGYRVLGLLSELRLLNLLYNKHIPDIYKRSSIKQRYELLQGLMDSDGTVNRIDKRCEYTTTSLRLANDVYDLIIGLGIKATLITGDAKLYGRFISKKYRISFSTNKPVFKLKRKLMRLNGNRKSEDCRYIVGCEEIDSVLVKCIEVNSNSHLYLCTRSCIPTHNSSLVDFIVTKLNIIHGWKVGYFTPENYPIKYHIKNLIELITGGKFSSKSMGESIFDQAFSYVRDNFRYILDEEDFSLKTILTSAKYLVRQFGIKVLVVDPYNKIEYKGERWESETQYINRLLDELTNFAKFNQVLVILVAHPRKMELDGSHHRCPNLYDISGSAHFFNKCDYGLTVYREKYIEEDRLKDEIQIHWQKIKYKNLGKMGVSYLKYVYDNGRFYDGNPAHTGSRPDTLNWLNKEPNDVELFNVV